MVGKELGRVDVPNRSTLRHASRPVNPLEQLQLEEHFFDLGIGLVSAYISPFIFEVDLRAADQNINVIPAVDKWGTCGV